MTVPSTATEKTVPIRSPFERAIIQLGTQLKFELENSCLNTGFDANYATWIERWQKTVPAFAKNIPLLQQVLTLLDGYDDNETVTRQQQAQRARNLLAEMYQPRSILDAALWRLHWLSHKELEALANLGLFTVRDVLYHLPRRYEDRSTYVDVAELADKTKANVIGTIIIQRPTTHRQRPATEIIFGDGNARFRAVFFASLPAAIRDADQLSRIAVSGKVHIRRTPGQKPMLTMYNPQCFLVGTHDTEFHTGNLIPIHSLTKGISDQHLRTRIAELLEAYADRCEYLPATVLAQYQLLPAYEALKHLHFPSDENLLDRARQRLAFDELLILQLGIQRRKTEDQANAPVLYRTPDAYETYKQALRFVLTRDQEQAITAISYDMARSTPMFRLLQGDVGSGKTAVAMAAAVQAVAAGYQVAIMAPTALLAEQHLHTFRTILGQIAIDRAPICSAVETECMDPEKQELFNTIRDVAKRLGIDSDQNRNIRIEGLSGQLTVSERRRIYAALARGDIDIIVGTHALIANAVSYAQLGLVIVDEQHRFGVEQRRRLTEKGASPHVLMMTATPIPRTSIQTFYGELDISQLLERPPGRLDIKTTYERLFNRDNAYARVREQVVAGNQAFIVCPLIEDNEDIDWPAVESRYEQLQQHELCGLRIEMLHGRMHSERKEQIMRQFRDHEFDVLVTTQVIEVGIDVPKATVIVIEAADRFGYAQVHQLRGRVGRGEHQSYCILVSATENEDSEKRIRKICSTLDGFELARADLNARGPGQFFGDRQSGTGDFKVAKYWDWDTLSKAKYTAREILKQDPALLESQNQGVAEAYRRRWENVTLGG